MKTALLFCLAVVGLANAHARPVAMCNDSQKLALADLVVVAKPVQVEDTKERINLPGISVARSVGQASEGLPVVGVNTRFAVLSVRKGDPASKEIVMHHYRLATPEDAPVINAANLVSFDPKSEASFLLFLKLEPDGRYAPLDQVDPGTNSVEAVPASSAALSAASPRFALHRDFARLPPSSADTLFRDSALPQKETWRLRRNVATSSAPDAIIIPVGTAVTLIPDPTQARFVHVQWQSHRLVLPPDSIE